MMNEWGLEAPATPETPGPTQTVTIVDNGSATLQPAPAGTTLQVVLPPNAAGATIYWNNGVSTITEGCYDLSGPCSMVLDGNAGSILVSWWVAPVGGVTVPEAPFVITVPGALNPPLIPTPPTPSPITLPPGLLKYIPLPPSTGSIPATCPSGQVNDTVTGLCRPRCWDGSAPAGNVCPNQPVAASSSSVGEYVGIGAAVLVAGGVAWWLLR
jgi:hypothetical protein